MTFDEHVDSVRADSFKSASSIGDGSSELLRIDPVEERRVLRKLDLILTPILAMFYLLSFLDRSNIGNARVAGLEKDLRLTDKQYQIAVTVLYVPYIVTELPANLLLRKIGPKIMMPTILTLWGMICALQGTVTSFGGLVTVRAFLGLVEGPMFPGIVLYLSGFYTRKELSLRIALFFSAASLSGAFSGLLAAAIENMDGVRGKAGWAWIFILEGVFTVIVGLLSFFILPSTPNDVRWLNQAERDIIAKRLIIDRPTTSPIDTFSFREVVNAMTSSHVLLVFVCLFLNGTTLYGLALFTPTIVSQLGFSATHTQLVSVGPFAVGFVFIIINSYLSDKYQMRAASVCVSAAIATAGFIMYLRSHSKAISYGSLFLSVPGTYALAPTLSAWLANNSEPHYRRASAVAFGFIATNSGGILSTWRYPTSEGPKFTSAMIMNITFSILIMLFAVLNVFYIRWAQRRKEQRRNALLAPYTTDASGMMEGSGDRAWVELGDRHPDFKYAI